MLSSIAAGALSFNLGSPAVLSPTSRAPVVSMDLSSVLAGEFVYGSPEPASRGLPGFSNPTSFSSGMVVPTARPEAGAKVTPMAGEFLFGSPVAASSGLPGFSNPTSFNTGAPPAAAAPSSTGAKVSPMAGEFLFGSPVAASKGLPGFANRCSFEI